MVVCYARKTTIAANDKVSIGPIRTGSISSLKDEQRTTLKVFLDGKGALVDRNQDRLQ